VSGVAEMGRPGVDFQETLANLTPPVFCGESANPA
jgi:hypothetical protein